MNPKNIISIGIRRVAVALVFAASGLLLPAEASVFAVPGPGPEEKQVIEYRAGGRDYRWVVSDSEYFVRQPGQQTRIATIELPAGVDVLRELDKLNDEDRAVDQTPPEIRQRYSLPENTERGTYLPVVYPAGKEGRAESRGVLKPIVNLIASGDLDLDSVGQTVGATGSRWVVPGRGAVLEFAKIEDALASLEALNSMEGISRAEPEISGGDVVKAIPTDPLFSYSPPRVNYQWHLRNVGVNGGLEGIDVNIVNAWDNYTGQGVVISIVDDGVETLHPDLFQNIDFDNSWDFNGDDGNPNPVGDSLDGIVDSHGTQVAGVAAARWNNGIGGTGSAPEATLIGLRVLGDIFNVTQEDFAAAVGWQQGDIDISNNSWGPADETTFQDRPLVVDAMRQGVQDGRGGRGRIFCFAAGNGGATSANTNHSTLTNAPESVVVAALNDDGTRSFFSSSGASVTISAPSGGSENQQNVTTTTLTTLGTYTDSFSGTSSATPLVAGVIALMLEANPDLGWRDVQEILISTARQNDRFHPGWAFNSAGFHFNNLYGAGMVDAEAAVTAAETWTNLPPRQIVEVEEDLIIRQEVEVDDEGNTTTTTIGTQIPDNGAPIDIPIDASNFTDMRVEHAILNVEIEHPNRTELQISLISPAGTTSNLITNFQGAEADVSFDFPLSSLRHWGEEFSGVWRVRIRDAVGGNAGQINRAKLTCYGTTADNQPPRQLPGLAGDRRRTLRVNEFSVVSFSGTPEGATVAITAGGLPAGLTFVSALGVIAGTPEEQGEFPIEVTVNNGPDSRSFVVILVVGGPSKFTLGEAIGQSPGSTTSTGDGGPWIVDVNETFDASDAAGSPLNLANGFFSQLTFSNPSAGVMTYAWRVSSEENADRVWFFRSGTPTRNWQAFASGERNWGRVAVPVQAGPCHWRYSKNNFASVGRDRAWVDSVVVVPLADFKESLREVLGLEQDYSFRGKSYWLRESSIVDGEVQDVARSPSIGNGQHSGIVTTVVGPARVSYDVKVESAAADTFLFLVNGAVVAKLDGNLDWETRTIELPAGTHELEWRYSKDSVFSLGEDAAFLRDIQIERFMTFDSWLAGFLNASQLADPTLSDPNSDPDGDGWTNFEEYLFGGNPLMANAGPLPSEPRLLTDNSGTVIYRYDLPVEMEDVTVRSEETPDMLVWTDGGIVGQPVSDVIRPAFVAGSGGGIVVSQVVGDVIRYEIILDGSAGDKRFYRFAFDQGAPAP